MMLSVGAQSNRLIKELEGKRGELQRQITESETLLLSTNRTVNSQLNGLATLTGQIEERRRYILVINADVEAIDRESLSLESQLGELQRNLADKRDKYAASVRYLRRHRSVTDKLLFIFSAETLSQTYRRLRYVREYADYQRRQGEDILKKQKQIVDKKNELLEVRRAKEALLKEREEEKGKLEAQEREQRTLVNSLRRRQRALQGEISRKRREANRLNERIDHLIAEEIEKARKRAEEEARREQETRRKKEQSVPGPAKAKDAEKPTPLPEYAMDKADRQLSGSFEENRGRLPMPITGPCLITGHYGQYTVQGLRNVRLDNKGIDIQGQPGAQARAVFGGKVAAVFELNGLFNILVRHGAYISVYCNLSTTFVKTGDVVTIRQPLGDVFSDGLDNGRTVLHFQLRKEKEKLNPEPWLDR